LYKSFAQLREDLDETKPRVLVAAAAHEAHTLEALSQASKEMPMSVILVGNKQKIMEIIGQHNTPIKNVEIIEADSDEDCARTAVRLVRDGRGNVLMKGALQTGTLLKAALDSENGIRSTGTMSHIALVETPAYHKLVAITDGGMIPHPTLEQKVGIVKNVVEMFNALGNPMPKIAALAASESVSDKLPETKDAMLLQQMVENKEIENCILEGPMSFDLAVSKESAAIKGVDSKISGDVDAFVVPDISTGNVMTKALLYWGNAQMAGCVWGAKAPIVLVSRGASSQEKLFSIMLALRVS
jgi:phosphate butyryltransferase